MRTPSLIFAAILLSAVPASAASVCQGIEDFGCTYIPDAVKTADSPKLVVFIRGMWDGRGNIPRIERIASARQVFGAYSLENLADDKGLAVLVVGSSQLGAEPGHLVAVQNELNGAIGHITVASFSRGHLGLKKTLEEGGLPVIDRILMLDNFYFDRDGPDLTPIIEAVIENGAACAGFYTRHNRTRYEERFRDKGVPKSKCVIESSASGHWRTVSRCMSDYMDGTACP